MNSEETINKADLLLRTVPNLKASNASAAPPKPVMKEKMQCLLINEELQEQIMDTLRYIHGPEFKLKDATNYENMRMNLKKKYWLGQDNLVIKGVCDFSKDDLDIVEEKRLKQFALLRLASYGFHKNHCIEALSYCDDNVEDALYLLYNKYFNPDGMNKTNEHNYSELLEQRIEEKSSLESIYEQTFHEKVLNEVWIITLKLDYLIKIFHKKIEAPAKKKIENTSRKKAEKCRNFMTGKCKYGNKCRFSHEEDVVVTNPNSHLTNFTFELEIRFPANTKYPYEPPLILLKTDAVLPPLVNLQICKRLYEEAKLLAEDGIPCVYTIVELLKNEEEISTVLQSEFSFLGPKERLCEMETSELAYKPKRPSHYLKGVTNRDKKKLLSLNELRELDRKIVSKYGQILNDKKYLQILGKRKQLPAWPFMNDILNAIETSQVVIISGETGCGKSTQVPQFILDDWLANYHNDNKHIEIVCTQPRRISAIGVAERVAEERMAKVGNTVGYQIRLESKISPYTRLTFCTTGILLKRLEGEPTLPQVTHIIVDEVHERSEQSDFLLLILKELMVFRPDLKIILMSATMNAQLFADYFGDCPIIDIPGSNFFWRPFLKLLVMSLKMGLNIRVI